MHGRLLVGKGPSQKIAILPRSRGKLQSERQSVGVETSGHDNRGNANRIHPSGAAVRAIAPLSGNRFVVAWHLQRRINETI